MKHKRDGHTGHKHEIAKALGHKPDPKPKSNKAFNTNLFGKGGKDKMAHATHHAANAHHGMDEGMSPSGELGTYASMEGSHLGCNECHYGGDDSEGQSERGMGEGNVGGEDHGGGESSEG